MGETLGQIAYEVGREPWMRTWAELATFEQEQWDAAAKAVAERCAKVIEDNSIIYNADGPRLAKRPKGEVSALLYAEAIRSLINGGGNG